MDHVMYEINTLLQLMICTFLWYQIGHPKISYLKTMIVFFTPYVISYVVFTFWVQSTITDNIHVFIRFAITIAVLLFLYQDNFLKKCFMFALTYLPLVVIEKIILFMLPLIFHKPREEFLVLSDALPAGMMMTEDLMLVVYIFICLIYKRKDIAFRKNMQYLFIMITFTAIHFVSLIVYYSDNSVIENKNNNMIQFVYQALLFILIFVQYFNTLRSQRLLAAEENLKHLESEMKHTYDYYMLADEKFSEISSLRHDMQNQMQTVKCLIADGKNTAEAQKIMNQIQERLSATKAVHFCENPIINSVLTVKLNEIGDSDIETDILLKDCDNLPFDNYDICSLFANLFDNAFEACQKMDASEERFIEMKSGIQNDYFVLKVRNSCNASVHLKSNRLPKSSKSEPNHGYGTKIIESIAKKYDGSFQLKYQNHIMSAVVVMYTD